MIKVGIKNIGNRGIAIPGGILRPGKSAYIHVADEDEVKTKYGSMVMYHVVGEIATRQVIPPSTKSVSSTEEFKDAVIDVAKPEEEDTHPITWPPEVTEESPTEEAEVDYEETEESDDQSEPTKKTRRRKKK